MTDLTTRLAEARKQIQITREGIEDGALTEDLQEADAIIEAVETDLADRSEDP